MTTLYIILISLFTTGILAGTYCDEQMREVKKNAEKHQHPCGLPPDENCCIFAQSNFDKSPSGVYRMKSWRTGHLSIVDMYCDTTTANGGWIVLQRRKDGSENFHRPWVDYERGFGDLNGEFWYGLKSMHYLTQIGQWELRVDFKFSNGTRSYLHYNSFKVLSPEDEYPLAISGFTGITRTNPFPHQNGSKFSTYDNDNDGSSLYNCANSIGTQKHNGGWWHNSCWSINLNHNYNPVDYSGTIKIGRKYYNPRWIEMKMRPLNCMA